MLQLGMISLKIKLIKLLHIFGGILSEMSFSCTFAVAESGNNVAQVISSSPIPIPHESATMTIPDTSYSSSEDEDFYDAEQSLG